MPCFQVPANWLEIPAITTVEVDLDGRHVEALITAFAKLQGRPSGGDQPFFDQSNDVGQV
jgi:hypothetical protein